MYVWKCSYCDTEILKPSSGEANRAGREHLLDIHRTELEAQYLSQITGKDCQGGCGYEFPRNSDEIADFVCPDCGTDNLDFYVGKAVWDQIERQ